MHELSIAASLVDQAADRCRRAGAARVVAVTLRVGRLSCVSEAALRFAFEALREGTELESADLRIIDVPVRVWCPSCAAEVELAGVQRLACPACGTVSGDIRAGRELDLESIDVVDTEPQPA